MDKEKQKYVAGFMMDYRMDRFIVIDKDGKSFGPGIRMRLQPPGGKIGKVLRNVGDPYIDENYSRGMSPSGLVVLGEVETQRQQLVDENPHEAMSREFEEETGVGIDKKRWHCFMIKEYQEAKLYFFAIFVNPMELDYVLEKSRTNVNSKEGEIKIIDFIDIFFDPHLFTFDTSVIAQFIRVEMLKGFFTKLDPEGVNSAYKN